MSEVSSPTDLMPSAMWAWPADIVEKILRGKKPTHIPIEEPTKFALVVNLNTAKAFWLDNPRTFLTRADKVIE